MNEQSTKSTILSLIRTLLHKDAGPEIFTYKEFQEFLTSERIPFLKISYLPSSDKLIEITSSENKIINEHDLTLSFYKIKKNSLTFEDFFSNVNVTFTQDSFSSLLNSEIDANILTQIKNKKDKSGIESYLQNFKERIISIEKKLRNEKIERGDLTEDNYSIICSPEEEIDFWKLYSQTLPR